MKKIITLEKFNLNKLPSMISKFVVLILSTLVLIFILYVTIKGDVNQYNQIAFQNINEKDINRPGGPFEVSISAGRYALTHSIGKRGSIIFDLNEAKFASPDVIKTSKGFSSVFTPGVGILAVPFFMLGNLFGLPQVGAFLLGSAFLLLNFGFCIYLSYKFLNSYYLAILNAIIFAIGTNGLVYAQLLTQHQLTIFLIFLNIYIMMNEKMSLKYKNIYIYGIYILSILVDFPNIFLLFPFIILNIKENIQLVPNFDNIKIQVNKSIFASFVLAIPIITLFGIYNYNTTSNPLLLGQLVGNSDYFQKSAPSPYTNLANDQVITVPQKKILNLRIVNIPFKSRNMLQGVSTLFFSSERAWWYYIPVIFFGIWGFYLAFQQIANKSYLAIIFGVVVINIVLYTSFGDPWGGWAFGPRYLLPSTAIFCLFLSYPLTLRLRSIWRYALKLIFFILASISISFNVLGAITTSAVPPKNESVNLIRPIPWNLDLHYLWLKENKSGSLFYNYYFKSNQAISVDKFYTYLIRLTTFQIVLIMIFAFVKIPKVNFKKYLHKLTKS